MKSKRIITPNKIIGLFSLLVLGNVFFLLFLFLPVSQKEILINLRLSLIYMVVFIYEYLILSIFSHYYTTKKKKFLDHIINNKWFYAFVLFLLAFVTYLIIDFILFKKWLGTAYRGLYIFILLIGGDILKRFIEFIGTKLSKNNKTGEIKKNK